MENPTDSLDAAIRGDVTWKESTASLFAFTSTKEIGGDISERGELFDVWLGNEHDAN